MNSFFGRLNNTSACLVLCFGLLAGCTETKEAKLKADYDDNTYVEYRTSAKKALSYRHKSGRNTKSLLQKKLSNIKEGSKKTHNCATLAIEYAAGRLGKSFQEGLGMT